MKKLVFASIITILIANFSIGQTIADLRNSKNPHNSKGEEYYMFLNNVSNSIKEKKITESEFKSILENSKFNFNLKLNDSDLSTYKSFFSNKTFDLENLIAFEKLILERKADLDNTKLLESIAYIKWFAYFSSELSSSAEAKGISSFESCLDRCMKKKLSAVFDQGNWIDQTEFILGTPATTAWMVASCSWSCS